MTLNLFDSPSGVESWQERLGPSAVLLRGFAASDEMTLLAALRGVIAMAPFRHMVTPGGFRMSVAMTNCGPFGWVMDRTGYRYDAVAPESGHNWPRMPDSFLRLAKDAVAHVGFGDLLPVVKGQVDYRTSTRALTATVVWASAWLMAWIASGTVLTAAAATVTCTASFPRVAPAVSGDLPGQAAKAVNTVTRSQTRKAILQKDAKRPFGLGNRFTGTMDQRRGRPSAATLTGLWELPWDTPIYCGH